MVLLYRKRRKGSVGMKDFRAIELVKSNGMKLLLNGVSFFIGEGDRIGLIGQNGTGKSTLLSILAEKDTAESGQIEKPNDYRIAYLEQHPIGETDDTVFDVIYRGEHPILEVVRAYERSVEKLMRAPENEQLLRQFQMQEEKMNQVNGWDVEVRIKMILNRLGITDLKQQIGTLSGGMKKRVGLAKVLIDEPDLLLLDEPTNHLDMKTIEWLEDYLSKYKGALLLVTHDRYFLERSVNTIFELANGKIERYAGNYQRYLEEKMHRLEIRERESEKRKRLYEHELQWMRQGAKARTTKQQARIERFQTLEEQVKHVSSQQTIDISLEQSRIGKRVFDLRQCRLSIGDHLVLKEIDWIIQAGDRIGIIGENGVGKSTLLNALAMQHAFDSGVYTVGETVRIAYYKQLDEEIPPHQTVIGYLREYAEEARKQNGEVASVSQLLEQFLFPRAMHGALISTLSGGERRRLYLLRLLLTKPNVLLLDEPTNDLDIETLTILEQYIDEFKGTVITVSHDRYFLDKVARVLLDVQGQGMYSFYYGEMSEYLDKKREQEALLTEKKERQDKPIEAPVKKKRKLTYHEQKEWEGMEETIQCLEEQVEEINHQMMSEQGLEQLQQLQTKLENASDQLERAYQRWEELAMLLEAE